MKQTEKTVALCYPLGWSFVPLEGKRPTMTGWAKLPRESYEIAMDWARKGNIGVRTGRASGGVVVVDIDQGADVTGMDLPKTVCVVTGSGGAHLYYRYHGELRNSVSKVAPKIDIRADGGQVVAPGSVHPDTGDKYTWHVSPEDRELADLPLWVVEAANGSRAPARSHERPTTCRGGGYLSAVISGELEALSGAREGTRNDQLFKSSAALGEFVAGGEIDGFAIQERLLEVAMSIGLSEQEALKTISSGLKAGEKTPRTVPKEHKPSGEKRAPEAHLPAGGPPPLPPPAKAPATALSVEDLLSMDVQGIPYIVERFVCEGGVSALVGPGGTGKTWLGLELIHDIACGRDFLSRFTTNASATSLVLDRESGERRLAVRIRRLGYENDDSVYFMTRKHISGLYVSEPDFRDKMMFLLDSMSVRPEVILMDSWARFFMESEIDTKQVSQAFDRVRAVCDDAGVSFVIIHHFNKGMSNDKRSVTDRIRGATDWVNNLDSAWAVTKGKDGRVLSEAKVRDYEEMGEKLKLEFGSIGRDDTLRFWLGDKSKVTTKASKQEVYAKEILRVLKLEQNSGPKSVAEIQQCSKVLSDRRTVYRALTLLSGAVENINGLWVVTKRAKS